MKRSICGFCLVLYYPWLTPAQGQVAEHMLHEESLIEESTRYQIPDSALASRFTEQDWVMLLPSHEVRYEEKTIVTDGMEEYTVIINESSQAKQWEHMPLTIKSDADGMSMFNEDGDLIDFIPHSDFYRASQDSLGQLWLAQGLTVMSHLPFLHDLDLEYLGNSQVIITGDENAFQLKSAHGELEVNHKSRYIIKRKFQKEFDIPYYDYTSYKLTDQGILIPGFKKQRILEQTPGGHCVEKIWTWQRKEFSHHVSPEHIKQEDVVGHTSFHIYPNPVEERLNVRKLGSAVGASSFSVSIYNSFSDLVWQQQGLPPNKEACLDLSILPEGFYTVNIQHAGENHVFKIFKK